MSKNLIISRDDVSTEKIQDFSFNDRLIKLPINKYIGKLSDINGNEIALTPPQIALANAVQNPKYRVIVACLSRRVGKTYGANWLANLLSLQPNINILVISPNYSLSQISFDIQLDLYNRFGIRMTKKNLKDRIIQIENNSTIRLTSANQVNSAVGRSYDLVIFDEAALESKLGSAYNTQIRPTLDKINSKTIMISTPRGDNWFKEFYERGFSDEFPEYCSIWCNWKANPRADPKDIAQAKNSLSKFEFAQEYLASFKALEGAIYNFDEDKHIIDFYKDHSLVNDRFETIMGLDLGFRDPTAFVVIAIDYEGRNVYIIDEYLNAEKTTAKHAEEINYAMGIYDISFVYIDSAAQQTKYDLAMDYDISSINANKSVNDGINYIASLLDNGRLYIHKDCTETIKMFINYSWDMRQGLIKPKPLHNEYSHIADAVRYALYTYSPGNIEAIGG